MADEKILQLLADFMTAIEAAAVQFKQELNKIAEHEFGLSENPFTVLKWKPITGNRLGEFEVAEKAENDNQAWENAYQILKNRNATLKNHLGDKDWTYYYWLYDRTSDRIYRKRRSA